VLTAPQVAQVFTVNSPTEPERSRQSNIDALWNGITTVIGSGRTDQTLTPSAPTTFEEMAARLVSGPVASRGLVARPLEVERNPDGLDVEGLDRADTIMVFASIAPAQMTRPASGESYRVEAPSGYDAAVRKTIDVLLSLGGNVVSVDLNAEPHDDTTFIIYDAAVAAEEPTENSIFGSIKIDTPKIRLGGVDETISLGTNYLKQVDLSAPDATSTTSTSVVEVTEPTT
jgi:hypothetical protein